MENMNWILGVVIILILLFLISNYRKKRRRQRIINELIRNWGTPKDFSDSRFDLIKKILQKYRARGGNFP